MSPQQFQVPLFVSLMGANKEVNYRFRLESSGVLHIVSLQNASIVYKTSIIDMSINENS